MDRASPQADGRRQAAQLLRQGLEHQQRGRLQEAERLYRAALGRAPDDPEALTRLGSVLNARGEPAAALEAYDRALAGAADLPEALNGRGNALVQLGRLEEALAGYNAALRLRPDLVSALSNRGVVLRDLGRPAEAVASYDRALALRPDHPPSLNNRGVALMDLGRTEEALAAFDRALVLQPSYAEALNNRGKALSSAETELSAMASEGRAAAALASFERAIAIRPDHADAHDNRALLLFELGRFAEAAASVERAIALQPQRVRFYYHLAELRRFTPGSRHLQAMRQMAAGMARLPPDEQVELSFALGKALADLGEPAEAFGCFSKGAALRRAGQPYDEARTLDELRRTAETFTPALMRRLAGAGDPSEVPVFVIGMPRSGTTLVEQILASHPEVAAAGETGAFGEAMAAGLFRFPDGVPGLTGRELKALGTRYLARVGTAAPAARRIVAKRPDNFRYAGLIHLALPNARLVHVRRDPLDTCVSCFTKLFGPELAYSFDLGELGRYHRAYQALMAHWREALPDGVMLEVDYEALVADLEGQTRRILAHCGLGFDRRCLQFHRTERRIRTASATQVRRPLYADAVGRWRAYEPFLGPLIAALGQGPG